MLVIFFCMDIGAFTIGTSPWAPASPGAPCVVRGHDTPTVWLGLDGLLKHLREGEQINDLDDFIRLRNQHSPIPDGSNTADWPYKFLSRKLHTVLYSHMDTEPRGVIESLDKCGFNAWRILTKNMTFCIPYRL